MRLSVILATILVLACSTTVRGATDSFTKEVLSLVDKGYYQWANDYANNSENLTKETLLEVRLRSAFYRRNRRRIRRLLARAGRSSMVYLARAALAFEKGRLRTAERNCKLGLSIDSGRPRVLRELELLQAEVYLEGYAYISAADILLDESGRKDFNPYLILAKYVGVRDSEHYRFSKAAVELDPSSISALRQLLKSAIRLGRLDEAQNIYEKLVSLEQKATNPQSSPRGPIPFSSYYLHKELKRWPSQSVLLLELANLAWKNDEVAQADWLAQRANGERGKFSRAARSLNGLFAFRNEDCPRACRFFDLLSKPHPFPGPYARALCAVGRMGKAKELLDGNDGDECALARAAYFIKVKEYEKAKKELGSIALRYGPRHDYWMTRAHLQKVQGDIDGARQSFKQIAVLAQIGIVGRTQAALAANLAASFNFPAIAKELRSVDYDSTVYRMSRSRPFRISGFAYRILADRAALNKQTDRALQYLNMAGLQLARAGLAAWNIPQQSLTEPVIERLMDRVPNVRIQLPTVGGRVLLEAGRADEALELIRRGLNVEVAGTPGLFLLAATAQANRQDLPKMAIYTNAASVLGSRRGAPWQELGRLLLLVGNEAPKYTIAKFLRSSPHRRDRPDNRTAIFGMGGLALEALTRQTISGSAGAQLGRGLAFLTMGQLEKAEAELSKCAKQSSVWKSEAQRKLFEIALQKGEKQRAKKLLSELENSRYVHIELLRGKYHLSQQEKDKAKKDLETAQRKAPYSAAPLIALASLHEKKSLAYLQRACELAPHLFKTWRQLKTIYRSDGDKEQALQASLRWYEGALQAGHFIEAEKALQDIEKLSPNHSQNKSIVCSAFKRLLPWLKGANKTKAAREGALLALAQKDFSAARDLLKSGKLSFEEVCVKRELKAQKIFKVQSHWAALLFLLGLFLVPALLGWTLKRAHSQ